MIRQLTPWPLGIIGMATRLSEVWLVRDLGNVSSEDSLETAYMQIQLSKTLKHRGRNATNRNKRHILRRQQRFAQQSVHFTESSVALCCQRLKSRGYNRACGSLSANQIPRVWRLHKLFARHSHSTFCRTTMPWLPSPTHGMS